VGIGGRLRAIRQRWQLFCARSKKAVSDLLRNMAVNYTRYLPAALSLWNAKKTN
jgi:hypothetical protein